MKKFILGFVLGSIIFSAGVIFAEQEFKIALNPYPVIVNRVKTPVEGYNINGYTYLKLSDVGKVLDAIVKFNQTDSVIEITKTGSDNMSKTVSDSVYKDATATPTASKQPRVREFNGELYLEPFQDSLSENLKLIQYLGPDKIKVKYLPTNKEHIFVRGVDLEGEGRYCFKLKVLEEMGYEHKGNNQ